MDLFKQPRPVSEDTLHYTIYPPIALQDKVSAASLVARIDGFTSNLLPNFLWHRDSFQLKVVPDFDARRGEDRFILEGRMRVGDCVDDEWCAVWLLREISSNWDVVISVNDADGEFLLIEAADFLPNWVNPSNAVNRVWIYNGRLHLVPLVHVSAPNKQRKRRGIAAANEEDDESSITDSYIAVDDALRLVRDSTTDTLAPKQVEDAVWKRISGYPDASRLHVHSTKAYLPIDIARALSVDPSLVQKPVEAFYTRDALQLRAAHRMTRFPPRPNVLRNVKITRTAYAQLMGQKFYPPTIFGTFEEPEGTDTWRWRDIGMKLACGFEMLFQESKNRANIAADQPGSSSEARKDALRRTLAYKSYISQLVSTGYFRNEIEGSKNWNDLEDKASEVYVEALRASESSRQSFAMLFNAALTRSPKTLSDTNRPEDSDEWMKVDASSFDEVLTHAIDNASPEKDQSAMDVDSEGGGNRFIQEQSDKLHNLAQKIEQFVEGQGDLEGARFEDDMSDDDDMEASDQELDEQPLTDSDDEEPDEKCAENDAARQEAIAKLVPPLPASEYGQMPASFNSQRVSKTTIETATVETPSSQTAGSVSFSGSSSHTRPVRPPLLPRDKYDGVDSDDESSSSDPLEGGNEDEYESEEDRPQVVDEMEVDMTDEQDEFIEFSRQTLGISDELWDQIIQDRTRRGAFVPRHVKADKRLQETQETQKVDEETSSAEGSLSSLRGSHPNTNPKLDSFEAVMEAMDAQLQSLRHGNIDTSDVSSSSTQTSGGRAKGKGPALPPSDDDSAIEAAMEAELKESLKEDNDSEDEHAASMDYNLIKNFLESYKSQAGLSGPVGNLAGRLMPDWRMPRDDV
ncbi:SGT1 protein-domain-containing protein [Scleroderma yunnanense]